MPLPTALTYQYTSESEIVDLASRFAVDTRLDDNDDETVTSTELARLTTNIVNYATSEINLFVGERYTMAALAESWFIHHAATVRGAIFLCQRRFNSVPESLEDEWVRIERLLQRIHDHKLSLADIPELESDQPIMSNVTIDDRYRVRRIRVIRPTSDNKPSPYPRRNHWPSEYTVEP